MARKSNDYIRKTLNIDKNELINLFQRTLGPGKKQKEFPESQILVLRRTITNSA